MILIYEDEPFYLKEIFEEMVINGLEYQIIDKAKEYLSIAKNNYDNIDLFIIDLMVFGNGNEFDGEDTDNGYNSGIIMLNKLEELENSLQIPFLKKKMIFTNRKGVIIDNLKKDARVEKVIRKSDVFPNEFISIIKNIISHKNN